MQSSVPAMMRDRVVDATGALTIPELMATLADAALVVTTDSGPFHLAGALGTPIVGLFRARRPEHADRYSPADVVFGRNESCAQQCVWDRCQQEPCRQMSALSVAEVGDAVRRMLRPAPRAQAQ